MAPILILSILIPFKDTGTLGVVVAAAIAYRLLAALAPQGGPRPAHLPPDVPEEAVLVFAGRAKLTHPAVGRVHDFARLLPSGLVPRSPQEWTW